MMAASPLNKIETAHQMYRDGNYEEALGFYTEALLTVKTKPQKIALHSNRAACFLKLHDFKKAAEECTSVLELDHNHTGALMLRAQTLVTLKEYHSALFDVNRLKELNPSSEIYENLEARLRTQLSLAPIPESEVETEGEEDGEEDLFGHGADGKDKVGNNIIHGTKREDANATSVVTTSIAPIFKESNQSTDTTFQHRKSITAEVIAQAQRKSEPRRSIAAEVIDQAQRAKASSEQHSKGWKAIPKPKGHSTLDYARWDKVEDDSSEDDDDDDFDDGDAQLQYRFRVRTCGDRSVN
ncbi:hypothetical protein K2173_000718 [Erythroxylum novogranatense]|uniref:Uncharacterized protein n=1 Tax=Erythroxylum novogranatense TaxID=1862640 RepID=A0AAV8SI86_9ROSI|nr:hypothetical protein K2173_000718 [Erythroxylum novogranatense]